MTFELPSWAVTLVALATASCFFLWLIYLWDRKRRADATWVSIPGTSAKTHYAADIAMVTSAVDHAFACLERVWARERIEAALRGWRINVLPVETWTSASSGQTVAGETFLDQGLILVGPSLAALAHEIAHVCEDRIDNVVDYAHATWSGRGIYEALAEYEARRAATTTTVSGVLSLMRVQKCLTGRRYVAQIRS